MIFEVFDRSPAVPCGVPNLKDQLSVVKSERVHFEYPSQKGLKDYNLELLSIGLGECYCVRIKTKHQGLVDALAKVGHWPAGR